MNSRVSNPESYIFSAIIYIGKDNFTSNDVAQILIERFSLPKSYFKAKAFAYNQIQCLVRKGLLSKVRKSGAYQYVYIQIRTLIEKYSSELEKVSGAKEIYEELIIAVPSRENEFRKLSLEQEKKQIKINEKINTLIGIFNKTIAIRQ